MPYQLREDAKVTIVVFDAVGRVARRQPPGIYRYRTPEGAAHWDGRNTDGSTSAAANLLLKGCTSLPITRLGRAAGPTRSTRRPARGITDGDLTARASSELKRRRPPVERVCVRRAGDVSRSIDENWAGLPTCLKVTPRRGHLALWRHGEHGRLEALVHDRDDLILAQGFREEGDLVDPPV